MLIASSRARAAPCSLRVPPEWVGGSGQAVSLGVTGRPMLCELAVGMGSSSVRMCKGLDKNVPTNVPAAAPHKRRANLVQMAPSSGQTTLRFPTNGRSGASSVGGASSEPGHSHCRRQWSFGSERAFPPLHFAPTFQPSSWSLVILFAVNAALRGPCRVLWLSAAGLPFLLRLPLPLVSSR